MRFFDRIGLIGTSSFRISPYIFSFVFRNISFRYIFGRYSVFFLSISANIAAILANISVISAKISTISAKNDDKKYFKHYLEFIPVKNDYKMRLRLGGAEYNDSNAGLGTP